ncbi:MULTISPECIES: ankyrin repeat domain-containing protein [unclassified Achromobacter]|uniref:ankyrin repeat domain-containing protein n=1 Tax=unclassified Achromobacter TaxID=2626865 RepID=UPI000B51BC33|nr:MULTISPECIES: ankyrin repeat domain-containing protein [unclassified Achromobacter]OWT73779.1 hypothetical protein CEY05_22100 [Achromobacter sp. HZ34]OWT79305.1 hypothetical protein CEY04_09880 [Achromobacter sp. HZ28]
MPKAKRKTLPKDFDEMLKAGNAGAIRAVFDGCDVNARGGVWKQTALAFNDLPDEVAVWLVENGADIAAADQYGETPLHARAGHWQGRIDTLLTLGADPNAVDSKGNTPLHKAAAVGNIRTAQTLLDHGARLDAANNQGTTPLGYALQRCSNAKVVQVADVALLLLNARTHAPEHSGLQGLATRLFGGETRGGPVVTEAMRACVQRIGTDFEFHRDNFNPESREETSAALDRLYTLFEVPPVPRRVAYDGKSPIAAKAATWWERHQELWELLVPSSGAASTMQGETIRISGRIARELDGNGGINWDAEFKQMADALLTHLGAGQPLPAPALREAATLVGEVKRKNGDTGRLCELAVEWVELNPAPIALSAPAYRR